MATPQEDIQALIQRNIERQLSDEDGNPIPPHILRSDPALAVQYDFYLRLNRLANQTALDDAAGEFVPVAPYVRPQRLNRYVEWNNRTMPAADRHLLDPTDPGHVDPPRTIVESLHVPTLDIRRAESSEQVNNREAQITFIRETGRRMGLEHRGLLGLYVGGLTALGLWGLNQLAFTSDPPPYKPKWQPATEDVVQNSQCDTFDDAAKAGELGPAVNSAFLQGLTNCSINPDVVVQNAFFTRAPKRIQTVDLDQFANSMQELVSRSDYIAHICVGPIELSPSPNTEPDAVREGHADGTFRVWGFLTQYDAIQGKPDLPIYDTDNLSGESEAAKQLGSPPQSIQSCVNPMVAAMSSAEREEFKNGNEGFSVRTLSSMGAILLEQAGTSVVGPQTKSLVPAGVMYQDALPPIPPNTVSENFKNAWLENGPFREAIVGIKRIEEANGQVHLYVTGVVGKDPVTDRAEGYGAMKGSNVPYNLFTCFDSGKTAAGAVGIEPCSNEADFTLTP